MIRTHTCFALRPITRYNILSHTCACTNNWRTILKMRVKCATGNKNCASQHLYSPSAAHAYHGSMLDPNPTHKRGTPQAHIQSEITQRTTKYFGLCGYKFLCVVSFAISFSFCFFCILCTHLIHEIGYAKVAEVIVAK